MSVVLSALWSYAGVAYRETEARALDAAATRRLRDLGFGRAEILLVDGETLVNRGDQEMDRAAASCLANAIPTVVWATPRPAHVPVERTVELTIEAKNRYGCAGVVYQTEAEFEYSNEMGSGTPSSRYSAMEALGAAHRRLDAGPTSIYVRGSLVLADAAWTTAWRYGMRPQIECYAVNESPVPAGFPARPDWAAAVARESMLPRLVGGWSYRVRLGVNKFFVGRLSDDERFILVPGHEPYRVGSAAGPRAIANFGDPKWGAVLGFFPGSWLKIAVSPYPHPQNGTPDDGTKPTGPEIAAEIRDFQRTVKKHGAVTKGYSVWAAPEMEADHYAALSPKALTGAALLP